MNENDLDIDWEAELIDDMVGFQHDPLGFVLYSFPWGEPGTELENKSGPRDWQAEVLTTMGDKLAQGVELNEAILEAVASGHGIGKSALVSWIILWALSTFEDTKGVVTANTELQLKSKTWAEVAKWHRMVITHHWFNFTATALFSSDPRHEKTWRFDQVPWSERNTEAFAGLHNEGKRVVLIFDEASAIPDLIWEVAEGALTDDLTEIIWVAFGNPTRNTGRFRECFGRFRHRWNTRQIDSRTVEGTNKKQLQAWVDDYGVDSDFVKVRVLGQFPSASDLQFIPSGRVVAAQDRHVHPGGASLVLGVDVARYGDDRSVIYFRRGRDGSKMKPKIYYGISTMDLSDRVIEAINATNPAAVFIDGVGIGGAVVDRLMQLGYGYCVIEVNVGAAPFDKDRYKNKRAEIWDEMKKWLKTGSIIGDQAMYDDLIGIEYSYDMNGKLQMEKKDDMKKRGLSSPDLADALALTFAEGIAPEAVRSKPVKVRRSLGR